MVKIALMCGSVLKNFENYFPEKCLLYSQCTRHSAKDQAQMEKKVNIMPGHMKCIMQWEWWWGTLKQ